MAFRHFENFMARYRDHGVSERSAHVLKYRQNMKELLGAGFVVSGFIGHPANGSILHSDQATDRHCSLNPHQRGCRQAPNNAAATTESDDAVRQPTPVDETESGCGSGRGLRKWSNCRAVTTTRRFTKLIAVPDVNAPSVAISQPPPQQAGASLLFKWRKLPA